MHRASSLLPLALLALACGSNSSEDGAKHSLPGNAVSGSVKGRTFGAIQSSYWIGKPGNGSLPTQIYLSEAKLSCADISSPGWDKTLGDGQLLELDLASADSMTFAIGPDADANYVGGSYNPSADGGSVTVVASTPSTTIEGSLELDFGTDHLSGQFKAAYCAGGVEP